MKIDLGFISTFILTGILKGQIAKENIAAGQSVDLLKQGIRYNGEDYQIVISARKKL